MRAVYAVSCIPQTLLSLRILFLRLKLAAGIGAPGKESANRSLSLFTVLNRISARNSKRLPSQNQISG